MPDISCGQTCAWHFEPVEEKTGGNVDSLNVDPGQTLTVLDTDGPGIVAHWWLTISDHRMTKT
jgi:hypothetical protein